MLTENQPEILTQTIKPKTFFDQNVELAIKREDLLHPIISGNKFRKLKYNLLTAKKNDYSTLLTFGGAFSNHLAAVAAAGKQAGIRTVGIIRGEEIKEKYHENSTLMYAFSCGMEFKFITRQQYKERNHKAFLAKLNDEFGNYYLLPEGGTNDLAVQGCEEILTEAEAVYDYICVSVGTGGTIAGLIKCAAPHQQVLGFSALKGAFQNKEIEKYTAKTNYKLTDDYCFGGYAKIDSQLVRFINEFYETTKIPLDPVYTGKMMYGIIDLINKGYFKENSRILAVHTGGLQGIAGMNEKLKKKNLPQINL